MHDCRGSAQLAAVLAQQENHLENLLVPDRTLLGSL